MFSVKKQTIKLVTILLAVSLLSACSLFSVYKIDIPQGTPLTQQQVSRVKVGMTVEQVKYLLGSPAIVDRLTPLQWDYLYDYTPGTYGKRAKVPETHKQQKLSVFFDANGIVTKVSGAQTIPERQYATPNKQSF